MWTHPDRAVTVGIGRSSVSKNEPLVPPKRQEERVIQRSIGLPESLWDRIARLAHEKGYDSRSEYLRQLLDKVIAIEER
jgi:glycogen synthase